MSIEVKALRKHYGAQKAVDGISFSVQPGQIVGFLGPNGAGKSTTMKMITGYLEPDAGTAIVGGIDVREDALGAKRKIGYLPESMRFTTTSMSASTLVSWPMCTALRVKKNAWKK
jgi:ABC-2 type transport system ATP-binding protein